MSASVNHLRIFAQAVLAVCDENDAAIKHAVEQSKTIDALLAEIDRLKKEARERPGRCPNCDYRIE